MNWTEKQYEEYLKKRKKPAKPSPDWTLKQFDEDLADQGIDGRQIPLPPLRCLTGGKATSRKREKKNSPIVTKRTDSYAETVYERDHLHPLLLTGEIREVESHRTFELLPKCELCGQKLKKKEYTPDYILHMSDGSIKVVEIKGSIVKKLQREYQLRKHLFIVKYCLPNGWLFEEIAAESLTKR